MNLEAEAANQRQRERRADTCVHFNGCQNDKCKAGLEYPRGGLPCIPPFREGQVRPVCPKFKPTGMEAVLAEDVEDEKFIRKINTARKAIIDHAQGKRDVRGFLDCPICLTGRLHYSIAGSNGHVHAECTTRSCVRWME
jgi:hypothetical protein